MTPSSFEDLETRLDKMRQNSDFLAQLTQSTPWANALGFKIDHVEKGLIKGHQPYADHLIGDPRTGIVHGGVITTFLDQLCGGACMVSLPQFRFVATLDLRIDYMTGADPGEIIYGEAECYHFTESVAFVRAFAFHDKPSEADPDKTLIATAQGAFAINKPGRALSVDTTKS